MVMTAVGALSPLDPMVRLGHIVIHQNAVQSMQLQIIVGAAAPQSSHFIIPAGQSHPHQMVRGAGLGTEIWKSPKAKLWPIAWIMVEIVHHAPRHALNKIAFESFLFYICSKSGEQLWQLQKS